MACLCRLSAWAVCCLKPRTLKSSITGQACAMRCCARLDRHGLRSIITSSGARQKRPLTRGFQMIFPGSSTRGGVNGFKHAKCMSTICSSRSCAGRCKGASAFWTGYAALPRARLPISGRHLQLKNALWMQLATHCSQRSVHIHRSCFRSMRTREVIVASRSNSCPTFTTQTCAPWAYRMAIAGNICHSGA